ncbi:MAG: hypothetical protein RJB13_1008 [Pseudomonadota bacterium]
MLELIWPGKENAAALSQQECDKNWKSWMPASLDSVDLPAAESASHSVMAADNLDALRKLRASGVKYDLIYIDPPYNTGSDLTYKDKRSAGGQSASAAWLNEIYPRMLLARDILDDQGVLFVSIDDNEICHLLTLLRQVFGRENHLGTIKWRRKRKPSFLDKHLSSTLEYVLVFARDARVCPRLLGGVTEEQTRPVLNAGNRNVERLITAGMQAHCPEKIYAPGEYKNRSLSFTLLDPLVVREGVVVESARVVGPFRIQQDVWEKTGFITRNFGLRRRVLPSEQKRRHAEDDGTHWPTNEDAQTELKKVFAEKRIFDFPKPVGFLSELIAMVSFESSLRPQRCLDFYAGSGSFLIAALEQTRKDHVRRQVDLVQSREPVRGADGQSFSDIAEICAYRVVTDSRMRGFNEPIEFVELT